MSQILKDLNKLAEKMGAPVVGQNISEQVRAISTFYGGTTHGANINERINEVRQAYHTEGGGEATLIEKAISVNGVYSATSDSADGYSKVTVNVPEPKTYEYTPGATLLYSSSSGLPILSPSNTASLREAFTIGESFTMEVCFKVFDTHTTNGRLFQIGPSTSYPLGGCISCNGAENKQLEVAYGGTWVQFSDFTFAPDTLYSVSCFMRADGIDVFVNGNHTLHYTEITPVYTPQSQNADLIYFRCGNTQSREIKNGILYSARLYNKELTEEEILNNYEVDMHLFTN